MDPATLIAICSGTAGLLLGLGLGREAARRRATRARLEHFVAPLPSAPPLAAEAAGAVPLGAGGLLSQRWLWLGAVLGPGGVVLATLGDLLLALATSVVTFTLANLWNQDLFAGRQRLLEAQAIPTLLRLISVLRAGGTLFQAIENVARHGPSPTREEFARLVLEVRLGVPIDEALANLARRAGTELYSMLALLLVVQYRAGGNLVAVLGTLVGIARQRVELEQEVLAQTAQQRLASWILVLLPLMLLGFFWLADPSFLAPLVATEAGRYLLLVAALMLAVGSVALHWAARVEA